MLDHMEIMGHTGPRDAQASWDARSQGDDGIYRFQ